MADTLAPDPPPPIAAALDAQPAPAALDAGQAGEAPPRARAAAAVRKLRTPSPSLSWARPPAAPQQAGSLPLPCPAPEALAGTWQFSWRAALPVRAPTARA